MSTIITIGRQYGSGGREVGEKLAQVLGIPFYDEEIIEMVAEKTNMHPDIIKKADEKATDSLLYSLVTGGGLRGVSDAIQYDMPIPDRVFMSQTHVIKDLAKKDGGVFVGRCADYILDGEEGLLRVFIYADMDTKIARIAKKYDLTEQKAKAQIIKKEKSRKTYYNYYTDRSWGNVSSYDLCINTGITGILGAVNVIKKCVEERL